VKTTLRLPDALLDELRRRSQEENRSINAVAVEALWRGLGREPIPGDVSDLLGSFIARLPIAPYDGAALDEALSRIGGDWSGLDKDLDCAREDQF
jgi:hypothetical protein